MWMPGQTWRLEPWRNRAAAVTISLAILAGGLATGLALGRWNARAGLAEAPEESPLYEEAMIVMSYHDSLTWTEVQSDG